jgi:hypothetical protein
MVAAFFRKNTLEQTSFELLADGFRYAGLVYGFSDVEEIRCFRRVLETKTVSVGSDYDHSISVVFGMRTGERVQLTEQSTWTGSSSTENVKTIEHIYSLVAEHTFESRMKKYLVQVRDSGYFEYSGWHFFPEQRKIINMDTKRAYSTQSSKLLKNYGFIEVISEAEGLGEKLKRKLNGPVGFGTLVDTDVFFALLRHNFGMAWSG